MRVRHRRHNRTDPIARVFRALLTVDVTPPGGTMPEDRRGRMPGDAASARSGSRVCGFRIAGSGFPQQIGKPDFFRMIPGYAS